MILRSASRISSCGMLGFVGWTATMPLGTLYKINGPRIRRHSFSLIFAAFVTPFRGLDLTFSTAL
jgi:hypothetical protein